MKKIYVLIIIITFVTIGSKSIVKEQKSVKKLPNIIYIFTDDLGYGDLGCFGAKDITTPNIDYIAKEGIKFTDFYSASSVCSPSRAGLLTGRMPQRMGINNVFFPESFTGMPSDEVTIAELLKKKNYTTGMVGKWHLGHREEFLPLQQGFDSYFGIPYSNDMQSVVYMEGNKVVSFKVDQSQLTKTYTEKALNFIDKNKEKPFFLYVAHSMPHVPLYASKEFVGTSKRGLYGDVVQEIDWSVGQIINRLNQLNLLENTLVVFSSDNGPWLIMEDQGGSAGNLREGKKFTFEGGIRVPTVVMWKEEIPKNTVSNDLATQMDWFPTIAKLVGIDLGEGKVLDGLDISQVLKGTGKRKDDTYLYLDGEELQCYRNGDWKIKLPYKGYAGSKWKQAVQSHDKLLFHIKLDPEEKNNLYSTNPKKYDKLYDEMMVAYKSKGIFPSSLVVRSKADNSHFDHLKAIKK